MTLTSFTLLQTCPDVFADSPLLPCSSCYILFLFLVKLLQTQMLLPGKCPSLFKCIPGRGNAFRMRFSQPIGRRSFSMVKKCQLGFGSSLAAVSMLVCRGVVHREIFQTGTSLNPSQVRLFTEFTPQTIWLSCGFGDHSTCLCLVLSSL